MTNLEQIHKSHPVAGEINISVDEDRGTATSLTELEARLHVRRNHPFLPTWRYHAAGRALARLREHGFDLDTVFDVEDLCQAHYHIVSKLSPTPSDECSSLEILLEFSALPHDLAVRIRSGIATLSDALLAMESRPDFKDPARIAGAVTAFATVVESREGTSLAQIPARLKQIDTHLKEMTHVDFGVSKGTFTSMKSRIRAAIRLVDISAGRRLATTQLLPAWQKLIRNIEAEAKKREQKRDGLMGHRAKIGKLIAFCHERRIEPALVTDETIEAMLTALVADGVSDAFESAQAAVYGWEGLQKELPNFPQQKLSRRYQGPNNRAGRNAFESLPLSFQVAWLNFETKFGAADDSPSRSLAALVRKPAGEEASNDVASTDDLDEDPFALDSDEDEHEDDDWALDADLPELAEAVGHSACLSPAYLANLKSVVIHAGLLVQRAGRALATLADVLDSTVVKRLLQEKLQAQRHRDPSMPTKNNTLRNVATSMISIARLLDLPAAQIDGLMGLRDKVDPYLIKVTKQSDGTLRRVYSDHRMGTRHKERIAAMANDDAMINWFEMIDTLHKRLERIIERGKKLSPPQCNDGVVLVLHALTRCCPLRRANLAGITVFGPRAWLRLPLREGARITVPREYVKNNKEITVELTTEAINAIAFYLKHVRPNIAARVGADPANPYLFPAHGMQHRDPGSLNAQFVDRNWKIGGFTINLHAQRHLAGKIMLDRDPFAINKVQQLLGHKSIETTKRYYAEINEIFAQREYHAQLEQHYAELVARRKGTKAQRKTS